MSNFNIAEATVRVVTIGSATKRHSLLPLWMEIIASRQSAADQAFEIRRLLLGIQANQHENLYEVNSGKNETFVNEITEVIRLSCLLVNPKSAAVCFSLLSASFVTRDGTPQYRNHNNHRVASMVLLGFFEAAVEQLKKEERNQDTEKLHPFLDLFPVMLGRFLDLLASSARHTNMTTVNDLWILFDTSTPETRRLGQLATEYATRTYRYEGSRKKALQEALCKQRELDHKAPGRHPQSEYTIRRLLSCLYVGAFAALPVEGMMMHFTEPMPA